ncbi:hypothetical protein VE02_09859 [Pseudogymnoascus sp. 03VT05]|nr:hypothetical protein VE02_09859 [Pseudogymnoascus sp. 03VT05]
MDEVANALDSEDDTDETSVKHCAHFPPSKLRIELSGSELNSELSSGSEQEPEPERELHSKLQARAGTRGRAGAGAGARAGARAQLRQAPELIIELSSSGFDFSELEPSSGSELKPELERELDSKLSRIVPTRAQA